ncbi:capsule biosynthesis protein [Sneathiella limimaris]|uniref:capsule biosynthesis protein n=1 Tax=Sneathiella limimaris TaxID=1964213 RepID=UPI00146CE897|nr:capsular biosynthesis protein [Sneathiella limimaris]
MPETSKRSFLFLQTIASPFFRKLGRKLQSEGYSIRKINFNGGDWFYWHGLNEINYRGRPEKFEDFLGTLIKQEVFTDFVLFGDCRPWHLKAIRLAQKTGIQIWVFEEGYLRPHWVTLEEGGVNANSSFEFDPSSELSKTSEFQKLSGGFKQRVTFDFIYNFFNIILKWRFPYHKTHRPYPILIEYAYWIRRLFKLSWQRRQARADIETLSRHEGPVFLFPLQLDSDFQIRLHSPFQGMPGAIDHVLKEFAEKAPENAHLLIKNHPLDNGMLNYRSHIQKEARRLNISGRITFIDGGDLNRILSYAKGVITVNSTVGITALEMQLPVALLGKSIYDSHELIYQGSVEEFWTNPVSTDPLVLEKFKDQLLRNCHVNGNFYTEIGMNLGVKNSFRRMIESSSLELLHD